MPVPDVKSCGFLIYREDPNRSFLLMRHPTRWDLPKGHVDSGESELECALRELEEETGISADLIQIEDGFRFTHQYTVQLPRYGDKPQLKELVVFLGRLTHSVSIQVTEHDDFQWLRWDPPHKIQPETIDPLLEYLDQFWAQ